MEFAEARHRRHRLDERGAVRARDRVWPTCHVRTGAVRDAETSSDVDGKRSARRPPDALTFLCLVLFTLDGAGCRPRGPLPHLVLATTTSVGNSGLLDVLAPAWQKATGIELRPALAGSGRALRMLANGQADVVISHAPEAEAAMMSPPRSWRYRKFMFNDFVLVDPPAIPPASPRNRRSRERSPAWCRRA